MDSHVLEMNDTLTTTSTSNLTQVSNGVEDEIIIQTVKLNKYFGDKHVLKDIDFEVRKREVVAVIGPSTWRLRNIHDRIGGKNKGEESNHAQASYSSHPERERAGRIASDHQAPSQ